MLDLFMREVLSRVIWKYGLFFWIGILKFRNKRNLFKILYRVCELIIYLFEVLIFLK